MIFQKGVPSEETGKAVGKGLIKALRSGGCVDDYLQDQVGMRREEGELERREGENWRREGRGGESERREGENWRGGKERMEREEEYAYIFLYLRW